MGNGWMPAATDGRIKYPDLRSGGSYIGREARGNNPILTLHTTEGSSPTGGRDYYHFTVGEDPNLPGLWRIFQWRSVERSAYSLRNRRPGQTGYIGVETNKNGFPHIQVAIATRSSNIGNLPNEAYERVAAILAWAHEEYGVKIQPWAGTEDQWKANGYGYKAPQRLDKARWLNAEGFGGHRFAPENTHWDPGAFDWNKLVEYTLLKTGEGPPDMPVPILFEAGQSYPEWEPFAWMCYALDTGELWDPSMSSSVVRDFYGGAPEDTIKTVQPEQLTTVWRTIGWGGTTGYPDSRPALYSLGKEATLFQALFYQINSGVGSHSHEGTVIVQ